MSLYGRPKTGKTRLACTFPKPLLILGTEDGTESVKNVDGVEFVAVIGNKETPKTDKYIRLDEFSQLCKELHDSDFATVVLDTASILQDMIYSDVMGLDDMVLMKKVPPKELLGVYSSRTKAMLRDVLRIPKHRVVISHEKNHSEDDKEMENSELMTPLVSHALSGAVGRFLGGEVDYLCQMFIREKVEVTTTTVLGKEKQTETKTGKAEYCLRVGQHPVYNTGFRYSSDDPDYVLPDVIVNPTYDKICKVIKGLPVE